MFTDFYGQQSRAGRAEFITGQSPIGILRRSACPGKAGPDDCKFRVALGHNTGVDL